MNHADILRRRPVLGELIEFLSGSNVASSWSLRRDVLAEANRHGVTALLADAALSEAASLNGDMRLRLEEARRVGLLRSLDLRALVGELVTALEADGVEATLLKGLHHEQWYRRPGIRQIGDVDLLVNERDVQRTMSRLLSLGFVVPPNDSWHERPSLPALLRARKDIALVRAGETVELHWRYMNTANLLPVTFPDRLDGFATLNLGNGLTARVLAPRAAFVYMSVHGAMHQWARLNWLVDVPRALHGLDGNARRALLDYGQAGGLTPTILLGMAVWKAVSGWCPPEDIERAIESCGELPAMTRHCLGRLVAESVAWERPDHDRLLQYLYGLRLSQRWSYRAEYTWRGLSSPSWKW